jgi:hypothetical protein
VLNGDSEGVVTSLLTYPFSGVAMDFCSYDTFTLPTDTRPLVALVTGFSVTPSNVPTTGLDTSKMNQNVIDLAMTFPGTVHNRSSTGAGMGRQTD